MLCKNSGLWGVVSANALFRSEVDLQTLVYVGCLACGCVSFVASFMALVSTFYRLKLCYLPVTPLTTTLYS